MLDIPYSNQLFQKFTPFAKSSSVETTSHAEQCLINIIKNVWRTVHKAHVYVYVHVYGEPGENRTNESYQYFHTTG